MPAQALKLHGGSAVACWQPTGSLGSPAPAVKLCITTVSLPAGLVANWVLFGSSGLIERPANPNVFQTYDMCTPMDGPAEYHVKTIANTDHVESVINPHQFQYKAGSPLPVSEDGEPVESHYTELHHAKQVSIYHYAIKSRQEFAEKMARKSGSGKGKDWSFFDSVDALSFINCTDWFGRIPWPGGH